jgi:hypothetical protein
VTAQIHRREKAPQRRQIRKVANRATDGGAPSLVLTPDVVHGLARNRDPTARFAGDLDHTPRVRVGLLVRIGRMAGQRALVVVDVQRGFEDPALGSRDNPEAERTSPS